MSKVSEQKHAHAKLELKVSCELAYPLATQVILLVKDSRTQNWDLTPYKTEVIVNYSKPKFVTGIIVDYYFEELQTFRFICINVNKPNNPDWNAQEVIGYFDYDLGSIVSSAGKKVKNRLMSENRSNNFITIMAMEVKESSRDVKLQFQAQNITKKLFLRSTPQAFLVLSRANEDGTFAPVYQSPNISSMNPLWPEFDIKESTLCNGDLDRALRIQIKNYKGNGVHVLLGQCTLTLRELLEETDTRTFQLRIPSGFNGNAPKDSILTVVKVILKEMPTFLDYIAGGTQINLVVAIDFTESNGDPRSPESSHYIGNRENDYQQAIRSVGTILEKYDSDKMIPVYGFGGKFNGNLSHTYPLNDNFENPEVFGVDGIMEVYRKTINNVVLDGPTNFSPIINHTAATIKSEISKGEDVYYILLIITDGVITDMDTTIRAIVRARKLPLSIVIVGIGEADFTNMNILDADDKPLSVQEIDPLTDAPVTVGRDIVQFIAMNKFSTEAARYSLPKAVMEEIPEQFMFYMKENNINPKQFS
ncbi:2782_t:CDS:10 [Funneliformis geosporum]|uniref:2782_t:CDS:1 n=1 Tax=Funneliformis geosporum TaxID=1117311 RepID=A0A9W4T6H5_9GLOM|nr:2782_t:CDS:10 [Funneliformis geosporum]